jgi:hypothetical protein
MRVSANKTSHFPAWPTSRMLFRPQCRKVDFQAAAPAENRLASIIVRPRDVVGLVHRTLALGDDRSGFARNSTSSSRKRGPMLDRD